MLGGTARNLDSKKERDGSLVCEREGWMWMRRQKALAGSFGYGNLSDFGQKYSFFRGFSVVVYPNQGVQLKDRQF